MFGGWVLHDGRLAEEEGGVAVLHQSESAALGLRN
jgi:hypothetical protein